MLIFSQCSITIRVQFRCSPGHGCLELCVSRFRLTDAQASLLTATMKGSSSVTHCLRGDILDWAASAVHPSDVFFHRYQPPYSLRLQYFQILITSDTLSMRRSATSSKFSVRPCSSCCAPLRLDDHWSQALIGRMNRARAIASFQDSATDLTCRLVSFIRSAH